MSPNPARLYPNFDAASRAQRRAIFRTAAASVFGYLRNTSTTDMARSMWPDDDEVRLYTRAAVPPLDTGRYPALTPVRFISLVAPKSGMAQVADYCVRLDLTGLVSIGVPNSVEVPGGVFVGEGNPIPVGQPLINNSVLGPVRKIGLISGVSREVQDSSPDNASLLIGRLMGQGISRGLDRKFFSGDNATTDAPAGILNGVAAIPPAATAADDVGNIVGAISDAAVIGETILCAHPGRAVKLAMTSLAMPLAIVTSPQITKDMLIGIGVDGFATGFSGTPEFSISKQATVHFNTSALPLVGPGGTASPQMSSLQQDLLLLKTRIECAWAVVQPGAVQYVSNITW